MASSLALLFGAPALEPLTVVAAAAAFTAVCALLGTATAADGQVQSQRPAMVRGSHEVDQLRRV